MSSPPALSPGQCAALACLLEVSAPKVGNVHRGADFANMTFNDFLVSSVAMIPAMDQAAAAGVGATVRRSIVDRRRWTRANTNLGIALLLAPLAAVPTNEPLRPGLNKVLHELTNEDSRQVYEAIQLAAPGGLGAADQWDVRRTAEPPPDLLKAMDHAKQRDLVARQYVTGYAEVFDQAEPWLGEKIRQDWPLVDAIVYTHLRLIAEHGDTLIGRKCGERLSREAAARAGEVLQHADAPRGSAYLRGVSELDLWLRSDGNKRNPGATADLIAAALFVALREGRIEPPLG